MTQPLIVPIVEGHGEIEAVPVLLKKIAQEFSVYPHINPPARVKAGSFLNDPDYFAKYVTLAANKAAQAAGSGLVFIILDCEDSCPAVLGPDLLRKANAVRSDVDYMVSLAFREYETWFLAAAESLRTFWELPGGLLPPTDPEAIRNAKGWLGDRMPHGYDPLRHQAPFTWQMDLNAAKSVPSFRRLFNKLSAHFARFRQANPP